MERQAIYGLIEKTDRMLAETMAILQERRIKHDQARKLSREILDFLPGTSNYFYMALETMGDEIRSSVESELAGLLEDWPSIFGLKREVMKPVIDNPDRYDKVILESEWSYEAAYKLAEACRQRDQEIARLKRELAEERAKNVYGRLRGIGEGHNGTSLRA